ncbi:helicase associated domain-containing protein [Streptomyces sp. NPDC094154]|uniref:helicase associated domain-containing protein n=1 Tax=Streptomyces sp. NPDC094154 TaxID=3366059 RepID=UPI00380B5BB6
MDTRPTAAGRTSMISQRDPRTAPGFRTAGARRPLPTTAAYEAAKHFYEREGHLRVPRKHVERLVVGVDGEDQEERKLRLGTWIGNQRSRAATLSPERVEQLSAIGMRWS